MARKEFVTNSFNRSLPELPGKQAWGGDDSSAAHQPGQSQHPSSQPQDFSKQVDHRGFFISPLSRLLVQPSQSANENPKSPGVVGVERAEEQVGRVGEGQASEGSWKKEAVVITGVSIWGGGRYNVLCLSLSNSINRINQTPNLQLHD